MGRPLRPDFPLASVHVLRQPGFALLWLSTGIYHSGFFLRSSIQGWLMLQLTNSSTWAGMVNGLPVLVTAPLSLLAGAVADRSDPRRLLLWTRAATALLCFLSAYLIAARIIDVVQLLILATSLNVAYYLAFPANQVYLTALAGPERLLMANALVNGMGFALNFIAPALAGYAAAAFGIDSVYIGLGLAYLLAMLMLLRTPDAPPGWDIPTANVLRGMLSGAAYVRKRPGLAWVFYLTLLSVSGAPFHAILPAMARDELGLGAAGFGLIVGGQGIGSLIGTFALMAHGQLRRKGLAMLVGGMIWAGGMIVFGSCREIWQAMLVGVAMGFAPPLWMNSSLTVIMTAVPGPMRARMATLYSLAFQMVPLGYLIGGVLADACGPGLALQLLGGIGVLAHLPPLLSRRFREIG